MNPEGDSLEQFYRNTTVAQNFAEEKKCYIRMRNEYNTLNRICHGKI